MSFPNLEICKHGITKKVCRACFDEEQEHPAKKIITDTDRINWLELHPTPAEIKGGADDGHTAKFWGIGNYKGTLRETVDHMIVTGSERQMGVES